MDQLAAHFGIRAMREERPNAAACPSRDSRPPRWPDPATGMRIAQHRVQPRQRIPGICFQDRKEKLKLPGRRFRHQIDHEPGIIAIQAGDALRGGVLQHGLWVAEDRQQGRQQHAPYRPQRLEPLPHLHRVVLDEVDNHHVTERGPFGVIRVIIGECAGRAKLRV